jgi:hypothetical protein
MTTNPIQLYKDVAALNEDKELMFEINDQDEVVYSLGILETTDVTEDIYHNNWR